MELLRSIKIDPIPIGIKKEENVYRHYEEGQSNNVMAMDSISIHKDDIKVKSKLNNIEIECKKNVGTKCECVTCICKDEVNDNIKLFKDMCGKTDPYLRSADCYDYEEQKIDISESTVGFGCLSSFDQEYLCSEIKIEQCKIIENDGLFDPQTNEVRKVGIQLLNSDKLVPSNEDTTAKSECNKKPSPTTKKGNPIKLSKIHAKTKPHECPSCLDNFNLKSDLDFHIFYKHQDDQNALRIISRKTYNCPECNQRFIDKDVFYSHLVNKHTREEGLNNSRKTHNCPECYELFYQKTNMIQHLIDNHKSALQLLKNFSSQIHNCHKCNKQFAEKCHLQYHIVCHHDDYKPMLKTIFKCTNCNKRFVKKKTFG